MIFEAYDAIRTLRLLLANHHSSTNSREVCPDWLFESKIRKFSMYNLDEIPFNKARTGSDLAFCFL
ncbi:TPA: hypothetical protein ACT9L1_003089 [Legionella pneumophila]